MEQWLQKDGKFCSYHLHVSWTLFLPSSPTGLIPLSHIAFLFSPSHSLSSFKREQRRRTRSRKKLRQFFRLSIFWHSRDGETAAIVNFAHTTVNLFSPPSFFPICVSVLWRSSTSERKKCNKKKNEMLFYIPSLTSTTPHSYRQQFSVPLCWHTHCREWREWKPQQKKTRRSFALLHFFPSSLVAKAAKKEKNWWFLIPHLSRTREIEKQIRQIEFSRVHTYESLEFLNFDWAHTFLSLHNICFSPAPHFVSPLYMW